MEVDTQSQKTLAKKAANTNEAEEDLYLKLKELENQLEILNIQEEYIRDEQRHLKSEYIRSKEEVSKLGYFVISNHFVIDQKSAECAFGNWNLC